MKRIAINRGFHFELFEKVDVLESVTTQYYAAIQTQRAKGENIQVLDGVATVKAVENNIRKRIDLMCFEKTRLDDAEQEQLWQDWQILTMIRKEVEEKLELDFLTVKQLAESNRSRGGYQLEFTSKEGTLYHVGAYLSRGKTLNLIPLGRADNIRKALKAICERRPIPVIPKEQLSLFSNGE